MKFDKVFSYCLRFRVLQHILFWMLSVTVLTFLLKVSATPDKIDIIFAIIFHIPIWIGVYVNLYILISKILKQNKYTGYFASVLALISLLSWFYEFLFGSLIDVILPGYFFISYFEFWDYFLFLSAYIILTTLIKLAKGWFRLAEIENEKKDMELQLIRSQLNPHFLFNTLNTLYGEALNKEKTLPDSILNLSDMLRYSLYESNKTMVNAANEIDFIRSYFTLQQKRFGREGQNIELKVHGKFSDVGIPPLIFLPLVENCFKHAAENEKGGFCIKIKIVRQKKSIVFTSENTYKTQSKSEGGLGLTNTLRRLDLLYSKNNYTFEENKDDSVYVVKLTLGT
ncbi:sensor histidine kinase [Saccharicrinis sp. FJH62]|uniref:sensor histidine kinase n=1 Tax=Saccharicrinis sp. FJH62 TaxID=3344657 RepID=UPI0035D4C5A9